MQTCCTLHAGPCNPASAGGSFKSLFCIQMRCWQLGPQQLVCSTPAHPAEGARPPTFAQDNQLIVYLRALGQKRRHCIAANSHNPQGQGSVHVQICREARLNPTGTLQGARARTGGLLLVHVHGDAGLERGALVAREVPPQRQRHHLAQLRLRAPRGLCQSRLISARRHQRSLQPSSSQTAYFRMSGLQSRQHTAELREQQQTDYSTTCAVTIHLRTRTAISGQASPANASSPKLRVLLSNSMQLLAQLEALARLPSTITALRV